MQTPVNRLGPGIVGALAAILLVANLMLIWQNRRLAAVVASQTLAMEPLRGAQVPALRGVDPRGRRLTLDYAGQSRRTLLLVSSTNCAACDRNWGAWEKLLKRLDAASVRPVVVNLSGEVNEAYLRQHGVGDIPVFAGVDAEVLLAYNLRLSPQTVLVDRQGVVKEVWSGQLAGVALKRLEEAVCER